MSAIHQAAQTGFTQEATTYTHGRPDYPAALRGWLEQALGLTPGTAVVDLGAGTGKFSRLLTSMQLDVTAIEPVAAMRQQFAQQVPGVPILEGTAEAIPLPDASTAAVVCAQAFHWFANEAALAQIHRVLTPGGQLGLIWNVRDESVDWVQAITDIISPYEGDTPRFHSGAWREAFASGRYFSEPQVTRFEHSHAGPAETVIMDRFLSVSFIAALPEKEKAEVAARLRELVKTHPALCGRETVVFPYWTEAYRCERLG